MDTLGTAQNTSSGKNKVSTGKPNESISTFSSVDAGTKKSVVARGMNKVTGEKVRTLLRARLGEDIYSSWFNALEFDSFQDGVVKTSVPVKFLCSWIQSHYADDLLECCKAEFKGAVRVEVSLRQPGGGMKKKPTQDQEDTQRQDNERASAANAAGQDRAVPVQAFLPQAGRTQVAGFEGSPLDPRYNFENFVVGASNRMAHAGATQVAETALGENSGFNPLYIHSSVGLGKTHLLHAIAWEVKRRTPHAKVLYLTAERFRYQFVEALRSNDPMRFKEKFRSIDILLIDDLEFLHGDKTEQEFDHIINSLLDGGRQIVVASARAPRHIDRLNERMRSRLQRGLVSEIGSLDQQLRRQVLEKRLAEKRAIDPSFTLAPDVLDLLSEKLTENGRELEGAITRLFANWQYMHTPITMDISETVIRDLVQGIEPRRIKIEDILRIISRHFGVSKADLLSQRRHRSVVRPRQIGMYLAKQLTQRSLPEIGRRFGNRDHTTVLHAIRKIDGELTNDARLRDEIDELKKLLSH
ncbi:MAG: chromosomal replication initiator protein DnaA [Hyphomicrobiaceae bacterium]